MDYFNLKFHNTTIKNEIFAGIAMFMAMSYILVVNPTVMSSIGMDYNGVFLATVCVSGFATIVSAFYTKLPIALAPGLGVAGIFSSLVSGPDCAECQVLLLATYVAGILMCALVRFSIYDKVLEIIDENFRKMILSGVGMALVLYGVSTTGLLIKRSGIYARGEVKPLPIIITVVSLLIIFIMKKYNKKGHVLTGLLVAYVLNVCVTYYTAFEETGISAVEYLRGIFAVSYKPADITKVMFLFPDIHEVLGNKETLILFIRAVFLFSIGHFFDAIGTNMAVFDTLNSDIDDRTKETLSLKRVIMVDGVGNVVSGLMGTTTVTGYAESAVGVASGGKTGITAITTGCLFLMCVFFSPFFTSMATYVTAPALIYVGMGMVLKFKDYDRSKPLFFLLGLGIIGYIGMTFSIGNAVLYGLIIYIVLKFVIEKKKPVAYWWITLIFAAVNIVLRYVV